MHKLSMIAGMAAAAALVAPSLADAQPYHHHHHHYRHSYGCRAHQRHNANTGTVLGALGGGLIGHSVAGHGSKLGGTLIGAGVGAVAGHQIAKHNSPC